jgi:hypothetical protein
VPPRVGDDPVEVRLAARKLVAVEVRTLHPELPVVGQSEEPGDVGEVVGIPTRELEAHGGFLDRPIDPAEAVDGLFAAAGSPEENGMRHAFGQLLQSVDDVGPLARVGLVQRADELLGRRRQDTEDVLPDRVGLPASRKLELPFREGERLGIVREGVESLLVQDGERNGDSLLAAADGGQALERPGVERLNSHQHPRRAHVLHEGEERRAGIELLVVQDLSPYGGTERERDGFVAGSDRRG